MAIRKERDSLGEVEVPEQAYYGAQTTRALSNFPISGLKPHPTLVWGTLVVKKAAATANIRTGRLLSALGEPIVAAADDFLSGRLPGEHFVVDPFQAGAGTSHNMNVNEVLANRAEEILGNRRGEYLKVHPNDHVNMAQSTNDVFPTSMRLASLRMAAEVREALEGLRNSLRRKGKEFDAILKSGRTHLQDAVPMRLGQEFEAYAVMIEREVAALEHARHGLLDLGIGGTAIGTGLNAQAAYIDFVVEEIARETGFPVRRAANLVETTQNMAPFVGLSSALKSTAVCLAKIAADLRLLASGPRTGLNEINLPALQPGSSIMPGKVNPVMTEVLTMVSYQVMGADTTVTVAAQAGQLELNVMMPVIAYNLLFPMEILKNVIGRFTTLCIDGITANEDRCRSYMETSLGLVTVLAPYIGYMAAADVAKESAATGTSIRDVVLQRGLLTDHELSAVLEPYQLTSPGVPGKR